MAISERIENRWLTAAGAAAGIAGSLAIAAMTPILPSSTASAFPPPWQLHSNNSVLIHNIPAPAIHSPPPVFSPPQLPAASNQVSVGTLGSALLHISATGADIEILRGRNDTPLIDTTISSTGADQVLYLPKGQALSAVITGTGVDLRIASSIADQVQVSNLGTGSDIEIVDSL